MIILFLLTQMTVRRKLLLIFRGHDICSEHKLYVAMLARSTTEEDVRAMFMPFGNILEIFLMRGPDGKAKGANECLYFPLWRRNSVGTAFVKYDSLEDANRAIEALNGKVTDKVSTSVAAAFVILRLFCFDRMLQPSASSIFSTEGKQKSKSKSKYNVTTANAKF